MASQSLTPPASAAAQPDRVEQRKFLSAPGLTFLVLVTQVPFALAMAPLLIAYETSGMWAAYGDSHITGSSYR